MESIVFKTSVDYRVNTHDWDITKMESIGIWVAQGSFNHIKYNNISRSLFGILVSNGSLHFGGFGFVGNNVLSNNYLSKNQFGIAIIKSEKNLIQYTKITNSTGFLGGGDFPASSGVFILKSNSNSIIENNIEDGLEGIVINYSSLNIIYKNNLINNTNQAQDNTNNNSWNSPYPSGGNYWSDYTGIDLKSGTSQNLPGSDDIGDTPYNISGGAGAQDRYPLVAPYIAEGTPTPSPTPSTGGDVVSRYAGSDGIVQRSEAVQAVMDYFAGTITRQEAIDAVMAYFSG